MLRPELPIPACGIISQHPTKSVWQGPVLVDVVDVLDLDKAPAVETEGVRLVVGQHAGKPVLRDVVRAAGDGGEAGNRKTLADRAIEGGAVIGERERRLHARATGRDDER